MSAYEKAQTKTELCKKHAARSEKDTHRPPCPSKLSKRELEDLYYSLLENNLELKKTINAQNEKNRILSTKVQRMTAQTKSYVDNDKDCCGAGKAVINMQKEAIADLTKANEAMGERVRRLSTQLCTAKQFLNQNTNSRNCYKCYVNATTSVKNLSTTSLQNKMSDVNLKSPATSARSADRGPPTTRTAETNASEKDVENVEKGDTEKVCKENRCRTIVEEFKQKIEELEEELARTHEEYSRRMTQLENQVGELQCAAVRARSQQGARAREDARELARGLREAGTDKAELETQLSTEKKRVAELEMRLKAAEVSQQVAKALVGHINTANRLEERQLRQTSIQRYSVSSKSPEGGSPRRTPNKTASKRLNELTVPEDKLSKSDDSGYVDHRRDSFSDEKSIDRTNQDLIKKISELQVQLDALKSCTVKRNDAELDASSYRKTSITYDKNWEDWEDERKTSQANITKQPQISIVEPESMATKKTESAQADVTKEYSSISKLERNDIDINARSPPNEKRELDNSVTKQPDKTNVSDKEKKTSSCCGKFGSKDNASDSYSPSSKDAAINQQLHSSVTKQPGETNVSPRKDRKTSGGCGKNGSKENVSDSYSSASKDTAIDKQLDSPVTKQPGETNVFTRKDKKTSSCCGKGGSKENELDSYSLASKGALDKDEDDVSESNKSKRDTQVIFPSRLDTRESQVIKPKAPDHSSPEDSSRPLPDAQTPKSSIRKFDDHNYQQIPGPIPTQRDSASSKRNNQELAANWKKARNYGKRKSNDDDPNKNQAVEIEKTALTKDRYIGSNVKTNQDKITSDGETSYDTGIKDLRYDDKDVPYDARSKTAQQGTFKDPLKQSIKEKQPEKNVQERATPSGLSTNLKYGRNTSKDRETKTTQLDKTVKPKPNQELDKIDEFGAVLRDAPIGTSTPIAQNRPATLISPQTYTVDSDGKQSRATSPENTDHEISGMSDLPTEKDATTPRDALSPGEHKTTATTTESYSLPNVTLSEGEVPVDKYPRRRTSKSVGEASINDHPAKDNPLSARKSSSERMEAALEAISQELARCRWLLQSQRTREQWQSKDVATGVDNARDSLTLRRTCGMSRMDGSVVPTCLFIVHIATVVLADEAVIRSRDTRFILTWKFFDSDSTVTPMGVGRVLNYHFSTQYYVEMTRDVVNYLNKEDMLIMMWEVGSTQQPFATCALPLGQVLINANKRVDFSLPLRAGSYLRETSKIVKASDDIGVLDVWCMLHCDRMNLPVANRTDEENNAKLNNSPYAGQPKATKARIQDQQNRGNQCMNVAAGKSVSTALDEKPRRYQPICGKQVLDITVLWLTLNGNCECMQSNDARKLYVAYTFLGRDEAELETPISLPKPKHVSDKCLFYFQKCFILTETDMQVLEHMVSCRSRKRTWHNSKNCIVFTVVSEPPEDPLGLENCEDIGFAFLYLGDLLAYSQGDTHTEVLPVYGVRAPGVVCGGLAVRVNGLYVLRALKERIK